MPPQPWLQGPQSSGAELESRIYPHIDRFFPGLEQVQHSNPSSWLCLCSQV